MIQIENHKIDSTINTNKWENTNYTHGNFQNYTDTYTYRINTGTKPMVMDDMTSLEMKHMTMLNFMK